ncbi:MAG TPA: serine/threonine-protein kinase [Pirellulales bacterium]|nr:serine/threonine-protein kinase [Pirellulales bacterium]
MKERDIFDAALAIENEGQRTAYLDQACQGNSALKEHVQGLLAVQGRLGSFLDSPALAVAADEEGHALEEAGGMIGPYKLLEQIGEGGFGVVFLAEQERPVQRKVAVKVVKPGMDTRQVVARFEAERQVLALMDHPNIAKVHDAGATENGRPYFVMELIQGVPITDYCDECHLTTRERLELFVTVCHAVQHAHQKGIIHRDLKPSNVLVTMQDGCPAPKIIDFGIAKALNQHLTDSTFTTCFAQLMGTPMYMSPEQAELSPLGVDTRTDVYSLGALLYELLTDATPFEKERLKSVPYDELRRIIREEVPPRPSARISTLAAEAQSTVCMRRRSEPRRLIQTVLGDLDWIVMKCLDKDRNRRYESANHLAEDVERFLHHEAVQARPPSTAYRLSKYMKRNRRAVLAVTLLVLVLLGGIIGTTWQAMQATRERERSEHNFQLARDAVDRMLIRVAEDLRDVPRVEQTRRALLEDALEFYQALLTGRSSAPEMSYQTARAHLRLGRIYVMLNRPIEAESAFRSAIDLLDVVVESQPSVDSYLNELADAHAALASRLMRANQTREMLDHRRAELAIREKLTAEFSGNGDYQDRLAISHAELGNALKIIQPDLAERHFREAVGLLQRFRVEYPHLSEDAGTWAHCHQQLGMFLLQVHADYEEAEPQLRRALEVRERMSAENPRNSDLQGAVAHVQSYLAELLMRIGRIEDAEGLFREAILHRERLSKRFPDTVEHRRQLGPLYDGLSDSLRSQGRGRDAEKALLHAHSIRQQLVDDYPGVRTDRGELAWSLYRLGTHYFATNEREPASDAFLRSQQLSEKLTAEYPDAPYFKHAWAWQLANCPAIELRDPPRAVALAREALNDAPTSGSNWKLSPIAGGNWYLLAVALCRAGQWEEAVKAAEESLRLCSGEDGARWLYLAMADWQLGRRDQAHKWYRQAALWIERNRRAEVELTLLQQEVATLLEAPAADHPN